MKGIMKRYFLILVSVIAVGAVTAQQDAMFTHYMYNTLGVNPGYAGSRNALTLTALHRSQWVSFPGAPETQTFTIHGPALDDKIGLGLSIVNDKLGPIKSTSVYGDASYRLKLNRKSTLAIGLKAGINYMRGQFSDILIDDQTDAVFQQNEVMNANPNFGVGFYYHREKFYAGLSAPTLLENRFTANTVNGDRASFLDQQRHYFLIIGGVIDLNDNLMIKPTSFVKMTEGAPIELDLTGTLIYRERYNAGLMYRSGDAMGLLLGLNLNEQLYMGYSFDWSFLNTTLTYNGGSHEVMLRYDFIFKHRKKIKSPRYF